MDFDQARDLSDHRSAYAEMQAGLRCSLYDSVAASTRESVPRTLGRSAPDESR
jgi:hypothetical protein